jgi:hypothetical protein
MGKMGLEAIYAKPRTTVRSEGHIVYPYLLRNVAIVSTITLFDGVFSMISDGESREF